MSDGATLKIDRTLKHVGNLDDLFRNKRPFSYIVETNTKAGTRGTKAKKNQPIIDEATLIIGDAIHNLRSALDHAYWEIVSPFATDDRERRKVQFPTSLTQAGLEQNLRNTLADRVGVRFFDSMAALRPYGEAGGNELLYAIHEMDIIDKHKLLIPTGNYTNISSDQIRRQVPDFPRGLNNVIFAANSPYDVLWDIPRMNRHDRRASKQDEVFEQELNVRVDIVFTIAGPQLPKPVIPTLKAMVEVAKDSIVVMRDAAR